MPNSQIQTASPLIRLRVGDFVRSNGTKFNMLKLFGLQDHSPTTNDAGEEVDASFSLDGMKAPSTYTDPVKTLNNFTKNIQQQQSDASDDATQTLEGDVILKRSTTHPYVAISAKKGGVFAADPPPFHVWTRCDAVVEVKKAEARPGGGKPDTDYGESYLYKKPFQYRVKFKSGFDEANPFKDSSDDVKKDFELIVLPSDLKPVNIFGDATAENKLNEMKDLAGVGDFFDTEKNKIMEAWESNRGRGLAGFITSLDFDYAESTYETTSLTRRAPKMVKVSIGFAPIHDIAPGMDNHGGFRAPIYPIGDIMAHAAGDPLANTMEHGLKNPGKGIEAPESAHDHFDRANAAISRQDRLGKKEE